jgi:hypothetical protein
MACLFEGVKPLSNWIVYPECLIFSCIIHALSAHVTRL